MIAFIDGKIEETATDAITVVANGIGYFIYCANPYSFTENQHEIQRIYTYQYVREDFIGLYGFHNKEERALFESLLGVSGIGPKGALAILAACTPAEVASAIDDEDEKFLTRFPGVGKKTARQMILDLKGKLSIAAASVTPDDSAHRPDAGRDETVEALRALGYADREIQKAIAQLQEQPQTTDEYIKKALRILAQS